MEILLLNISRLALKGLIQRLSRYEHVASNNTHGDSLSENVEQCGFPCTRNTHQCGQGSWLDPTRHVVQKPAGLSFNLDIVANVLPGKDISLRSERSDLLILFLF